MKTLTFLLAMLIAISANAQWYQSYGVTNINDLTQPQCELALEKAHNTITAGAILTVGGGILFGIGIAVLNSSVNDAYGATTLQDVSDVANKSTGGYVLSVAGGTMFAIGIPLWISGATRKSQLEVAMKKFDTAMVPTVGIKITF